METIVPFLSAAGVGGIVGGIITSMVQSWLARRATFDERKFREKKEAYVNFLQAIHESEIKERSKPRNMWAIGGMSVTWSLHLPFGVTSTSYL